MQVTCSYIKFIERKRKIEEDENRRKSLQRKSQPSTPEKAITIEGPLEEESSTSSSDNNITERTTVRCECCAVDIPEEFLATHVQGKRHKIASEKNSKQNAPPLLNSPGIIIIILILIN